MLLALSTVSPAFAAPDLDCTLASVGDTSFGWVSLDGMVIGAAWNAVATCPTVPALDGRTFYVEQTLSLSFRGTGLVTGVSELILSAGDVSYSVDGTVHGTFEEAAGALTLDLDVLAITDRVRVRVGAIVQYDSTDWDFLLFKTDDVELSTLGQ